MIEKHEDTWRKRILVQSVVIKCGNVVASFDGTLILKSCDSTYFLSYWPTVFYLRTVAVFVCDTKSKAQFCTFSVYWVDPVMNIENHIIRPFSLSKHLFASIALKIILIGHSANLWQDFGQINADFYTYHAYILYINLIKYLLHVNMLVIIRYISLLISFKLQFRWSNDIWWSLINPGSTWNKLLQIFGNNMSGRLYLFMESLSKKLEMKVDINEGQ